MQLGFVIDHTRCIGCHACTVACKAENDVPLGSFRTWVKYVEQGTFPEVRRSFAVLRCNQCSDAPCVTICPVTALVKRPDGIVDLDGRVCIGCKACLQACPYDALYMHEGQGTVQKCHFCAHRVERGLAPACAVVCPTEAIVPGDLDDPGSQAARLRAQHDLAVRKPEAGTGPNVFYREVAEGGIDPALARLDPGSIFTDTAALPRPSQALSQAMERQAQARTVYDVPRRPAWGRKVSAYLVTKALAAGVFPAGALALFGSAAGGGEPGLEPGPAALLALVALLFAALTGGLLIADLGRPGRFWLLFTRPNPASWLARGTFVLSGYAALLATWVALGWSGTRAAGLAGAALGTATLVMAAWTAAYTGWLLAQSRGRVLWMRRGTASQLVVQAALAGSAFLLLAGPVLGLPPASEAATLRLQFLLLASLSAQLGITLLEGRAAPANRRAEFDRARRLVTHGPFAPAHWVLGLGAGALAPGALLLLGEGGDAAALAGALALLGLWVEEDIFVRAGQSLPIS